MCVLLDILPYIPTDESGGFTAHFGKSSFLNGCIACLAQFPPEVVRFVFIDLKMGVEMGDWFNLPHKWLKAEDPTMPELKYTLTMILTEIKERMKLFNKAG